ncbi:MAG: nucleoside triphosphate pyrophosphohydrolase [Proteobacteria bacterium]|nr:nucleoside triphosphate pyrophosphohydrolase [Pseudomonadota bacterium]MBU1716282.1 nucleoside triphosphate pyrophosphohydrolase [Pseudomonadota bacterium]
MPKTNANLTRLIEIIKKLRGSDGCPWDQKQTIESFKPYLLEETHELIEAIDLNDIQNIKEEMGDLFFQILFLGNLYAEKGDFTVADALESISVKMVRRHPHVFSDKKFNSEAEMRQNWNKIKEEENEGKKQKPSFSFPKTLPALQRAQRVSERIAQTGFEWPNLEKAIEKLDEEITELKTALNNGINEEINEELGDVLLTLVNIGRLSGINNEESLQTATDKFTTRFSNLEKQSEKSGKSIQETDITELLEMWKNTKL